MEIFSTAFDKNVLFIHIKSNHIKVSFLNYFFILIFIIFSMSAHPCTCTSDRSSVTFAKQVLKFVLSKMNNKNTSMETAMCSLWKILKVKHASKSPKLKENMLKSTWYVVLAQLNLRNANVQNICMYMYQFEYHFGNFSILHHMKSRLV